MRSGVGTIGVVDDDRVTVSNLQRQVLHRTADVGIAKVVSAARAVTALNPDVKVETHALRIGPDNAAGLIAGYDAIADGSDSFATRLAVADAALAAHVPLVSAAIGPFEGQIAVFRGWETDQPCYRCFVGTPVDRDGETCADQGVVGALAGIVGAMQALEVIRLLTGFGQGLAGRLLLFDALAMRSRTVPLPKDPGCPACRAA